MSDKSVEHNVLWHQLNDKNELEAVFASPLEDLYSEMLTHAKYVASLAENGVESRIVEGDAIINIRFSDNNGNKETVSLLAGKPRLAFREVHFTNLLDEKGGMVTLASSPDSWKSAPDIFEAEYKEETKEE